MNLDLKNYIPIKKITLDSGLRLNLVNNAIVPIASFNLTYKVGSKDEKIGKTGFAHLFEHLMFEGSKNLAKGEFDRICSSSGGINNAYTTYDWTSYVMTLPAHQLEVGFWLESDRMFNGRVAQEALDNQKSVVTEEINQVVENTPYGKWRELLAKNSFAKESSYSWEVHGKAEDVSNATLNDVNDFQSRFYKPSNAVLTLAGKIDEKEAVKYAEKYFNQEHQGTVITRNKFDDSMKLYSTHDSYKDDVPLNAVFLSFHISDFYNSQMYEAELLNSILGDGKSSLLYERMVHDTQIASQVGSFVDKRELGSLFTIYAFANSPETSCDELATALKALINEVKDDGISSENLEKARNLLVTSIAYNLQASDGIADMVSFYTIFKDEPELIYGELDRYFDVKTKSIERFLEEYFDFDKSIRIDVKNRNSQ